MTILANRRIIVTGGSAGFGLAMVEALAERGADITAIARDRTKLGAAQDAGAHTIAGDATDAALIDRTVAAIDPDVLILNADATRNTRSHTAKTALGHAVAAACAKVGGCSVDEPILKRYGSHLQPSQVGRQVAELLVEPRYESGIA